MVELLLMTLLINNNEHASLIRLNLMFSTLRGLIFAWNKFCGFRDIKIHEIKSTQNISKCAIRENKFSRKLHIQKKFK